MKPYWKYIFIFIVLAGLAFSVYSCNLEKAAKEELINQNNINRQITNVETNQKDIDNRDKNLYPTIHKQLDAIDNALTKKDEKVKDEIKKANIDGVASKFTQLGYSSCVIRR